MSTTRPPVRTAIAAARTCATVVSALIGGTWYVVDGTLLAPHATLVRIATGRDAADTSVLSDDGDDIVLTSMEVHATVDGALPGEDVRDFLSLS